MSECKGCGTQLENCGAPIWEDYCPNKACDYTAQQFKLRLAQAGKEERKRKALEAAAPELYEALEAAANSSGFQYMFYETREKINSALAKARGETL